MQTNVLICMHSSVEPKAKWWPTVAGARATARGRAVAAGPLLLEAGAAFGFPDPIALVVVAPGLCQVWHVADVELGSGLGRLLVSERHRAHGHSYVRVVHLLEHLNCCGACCGCKVHQK